MRQTYKFPGNFHLDFFNNIIFSIFINIIFIYRIFFLRFSKMAVISYLVYFRFTFSLSECLDFFTFCFSDVTKILLFLSIYNLSDFWGVLYFPFNVKSRAPYTQATSAPVRFSANPLYKSNTYDQSLARTFCRTHPTKHVSCIPMTSPLLDKV